MEMFFGVASAAPITIPFILILWSITLFAEKKRMPSTQEDFALLTEDLKEFALMNAAVLVTFAVQIVAVALVRAVLG